MAWKWDTFKEWTAIYFRVTTNQVKVIVAAGLLAAGGLLWYDRSNPRYPTARDEAEIVSAILERQDLARHHTDPFNTFVKWREYPVLTGGIWTNKWEPNAIGLYPDRDFYLVTVTNELHWMESSDWQPNGFGDWIDLAQDGETVGSGRLMGRPWTNDMPFKASEIMDYHWWTNNIWADAPHHGALPYVTNRPFYMGTNMLNQIGKALTAYRWRWDYGSDPTNAKPMFASATIAYGIASGASVDAALDAACDALVWTQLSFTPSDLEHVELAAHYAYGYAYPGDDDDYDAWVYEKICSPMRTEGLFADYARYFAPLVTGRVPQVSEHGVITEPYAAALASGDEYLLSSGSSYYHNRGFDSNKWEMVVLEAEEIEGHATEAYRSFIRTWDGMFDTGEMKSRINSSGPAVMGWASGPALFVVDWKFQCLTNRSDFW